MTNAARISEENRKRLQTPKPATLEPRQRADTAAITRAAEATAVRRRWVPG